MTMHGWSGRDIPGLAQPIRGTWMSRDSWDNLAKGQWLAHNDVPAWLTNHPDDALDVGVPLIPHDLPGGDWNAMLTEVTNGTRDQIYLDMGASLAKLGPATVYARLWWEFNMRPQADRIDRGLFKRAWATAAPLIRAGFGSAARPGQQLHLVWCPLTDGADPNPFWPGPEHVDVVAIDAYATRWGTTPPTKGELLRLVSGQLDAIATIAARWMKPVALGEWGNFAPRTPGAATVHGLGDCPEYVGLVLDWCRRVNALYAVYFNIADNGPNQTLSDTPKSLAALVRGVA